MFWEIKYNSFFYDSRDPSIVILLDFMIGFDNVPLFGTL